ncbi:MAG: hypothetical protein U0841_16420 [Chloroflexia bacterium]
MVAGRRLQVEQQPAALGRVAAIREQRAALQLVALRGAARGDSPSRAMPAWR